jgi:hypothetical protein
LFADDWFGFVSAHIVSCGTWPTWPPGVAWGRGGVVDQIG